MTLLVVHEYQRALDGVAVAEALGAAPKDQRARLRYIEAKALQGLERTDEAEAVIQILEGYDDPAVQRLIDDLRDRGE